MVQPASWSRVAEELAEYEQAIFIDAHTAGN